MWTNCDRNPSSEIRRNNWQSDLLSHLSSLSVWYPAYRARLARPLLLCEVVVRYVAATRDRISKVCYNNQSYHAHCLTYWDTRPEGVVGVSVSGQGDNQVGTWYSIAARPHTQTQRLLPWCAREKVVGIPSRASQCVSAHPNSYKNNGGKLGWNFELASQLMIAISFVETMEGRRLVNQRQVFWFVTFTRAQWVGGSWRIFFYGYPVCYLIAALSRSLKRDRIMQTLRSKLKSERAACEKHWTKPKLTWFSRVK